MRHSKLRLAIHTLAIVPFALPLLANAQQQLEEVLVTAEKREQSIQDVPLSVAALAGNDIEVGKISGLNDIAFRTPGLTYNQFSIGEPRIYIRGIGNSSDSAGSDPAVGVFLDEVYIGRTGGTNARADNRALRQIPKRTDVTRGDHVTPVAVAIAVGVNKLTRDTIG